MTQDEFFTSSPAPFGVYRLTESRLKFHAAPERVVSRAGTSDRVKNGVFVCLAFFSLL